MCFFKTNILNRNLYIYLISVNFYNLIFCSLFIYVYRDNSVNVISYFSNIPGIRLLIYRIDNLILSCVIHTCIIRVVLLIYYSFQNVYTLFCIFIKIKYLTNVPHNLGWNVGKVDMQGSVFNQLLFLEIYRFTINSVCNQSIKIRSLKKFKKNITRRIF